MPKAKIISCEGADGLGKTTQVRILAENLHKQGKKVITVKFPCYDRFTGKLIQRMLKSGSAVRYPNVFQFVQWFDKFIFQVFFLPKLLRENDYLLFDRWHVSMWAYGLAGGANETLTQIMINSLHDPDLVITFVGKSKRDVKQDSYEADLAYQKKVALHYILWVCTHNDVVTVDADQSIEQVSRSMLERVNDSL